ncbi:MAG: ABC transporter permease [Termitinemataceae bacterium]|nr:MAG: ABC transporter permease [Termitinemataceae bacterium]
MIRIVTLSETTPLKENITRIASCAAALAASSFVMALIGYNPFDVFGKIIVGSLGSAYRFRETINKAIPLCILSLGTAIAFRMKFWNIGGEGQFYLGAFGASCIAFTFPALPAALLLPLMFFTGAVCGGLWALIPCLLKIKFSTNETLVTLMLNYVALKWVSFLQYGPWKDPAGNGFPKMPTFSLNAVLPSFFGVHLGALIAITLAILLYILLSRSILGYEIDVLGESAATARYAGINVAAVMVSAVIISGALCGAAGMIQASAIERSLGDQLSGGLGFTSVITAWLARLNPLAIVVVTFLFSILIQGGNFLQSSLQIPSSISQVLQGIIIFFVLGSDFFIRYRFVFKAPIKRGQS